MGIELEEEMLRGNSRRDRRKIFSSGRFSMFVGVDGTIRDTNMVGLDAGLPSGSIIWRTLLEQDDKKHHVVYEHRHRLPSPV